MPWVTLAVVGVSALLSLMPGIAELLEYDRRAVTTGQIWRPLTGQLVHWTARMTLADLGLILLLGTWVEKRSRRLLAASLLSAAALVAAGVHYALHEIETYRGSSGMATSLFIVAALIVLCDRRLRWMCRSLGLLAILLLASKLLWEMWSGAAIAAGPLPDGVRVAPLVHMFGAVAGLGVFLVSLQMGLLHPETLDDG